MSGKDPKEYFVKFMTRHAKPSRRIKVKAEKDDKHAKQRRKGVEHVEQNF